MGFVPPGIAANLFSLKIWGVGRQLGLLVFLIFCQLLATNSTAQDGPLLFRGSTVVTGFSGTFEPIGAGPFAPGKTIIDETFIDPSGSSARIYLPDQPGFVWDARLWDLPAYHTIDAQQIGQVFGAAIDNGWPMTRDETLRPPNLYLTATSAYGLNIVVPDIDGNGLPERVKTGQPGARFMDWQFGSIPGNGGSAGLVSSPGSIYKIDGVTRQVSLLTNITLSGIENSGPALGNIAFDPEHNQLFVSDRDTGMIHRVNLDGVDLGQFDHGTSGRPNLGLSSVVFAPSDRLDITGFQFDAEDPDTWAYARAERRVWGLAVHQGRLYYGVAEGPQIWSVGINAANGFFLNDARWELDVWPEGPDYEVSDIVFNAGGAMILAQRGEQVSTYDYTAFMKPRRARVYRHWLENPDDPATASRWQPIPEEYAVGFQPNYRNNAGGVDLNYGYNDAGEMDFGNCQGTIWTSGESLRVNRQLSETLFSTGELVVHGLQGSPSGPVREFNAPPWASNFIDYDKEYDDPEATGQMGDVEVYRPCKGRIPPPPPPPPGGQCIEVKTDYECNRETGLIDVTVSVDEGASGLGADILKVLSQNPGVSVVGGPFHNLNPAQFSLSGTAPNQTVTLTLCAFNSVEAQSEKPFTCCRAEAEIKIPKKECSNPNGILKIQDN